MGDDDANDYCTGWCWWLMEYGNSVCSWWWIIMDDDDN